MADADAFNLSHELFSFLIGHYSLFKREFPFLAAPGLESLYLNIAMAHLWLLERKAGSVRSELPDAIGFYCRSIHFLELHDAVDTHMQAADFADHILEEFSNRQKLVFKSLDTVGKSTWGEDKEGEKERVIDVLDYCLFERKGNIQKKAPLEKLRFYLAAHKAYLDSMSATAFIAYRIDWGLLPPAKAIDDN